MTLLIPPPSHLPSPGAPGAVPAPSSLRSLSVFLAVGPFVLALGLPPTHSPLPYLLPPYLLPHATALSALLRQTALPLLCSSATRPLRPFWLLHLFCAYLAAAGGGVLLALLTHETLPIFRDPTAMPAFLVCWLLAGRSRWGAPFLAFPPVSALLQGVAAAVTTFNALRNMDAAVKSYPGVWAAPLLIGSLSTGAGGGLKTMLLFLFGVGTDPGPFILLPFAIRRSILVACLYTGLAHALPTLLPSVPSIFSPTSTTSHRAHHHHLLFTVLTSRHGLQSLLLVVASLQAAYQTATGDASSDITGPIFDGFARLLGASTEEQIRRRCGSQVSDVYVDEVAAGGAGRPRGGWVGGVRPRNTALLEQSLDGLDLGLMKGELESEVEEREEAARLLPVGVAGKRDVGKKDQKDKKRGGRRDVPSTQSFLTPSLSPSGGRSVERISSPSSRGGMRSPDTTLRKKSTKGATLPRSRGDGGGGGGGRGGGGVGRTPTPTPTRASSRLRSRKAY